MLAAQVSRSLTPDFDRLDPERRLDALAPGRGALRRVVAALAARLMTTRSWERLGHGRAGDYAREHLGLSARSLQDLARVDRGLAGLPQLEAALVSGALPWSKVRLLARFATAEDEERWIARAGALSVRALEREVRAVDRGALGCESLAVDEDGGSSEPSERLCVRSPAALCFQWQRARSAAAKVAGERVSPGTALEWITAEVLSALPEAAAGVEVGPGIAVEAKAALRSGRMPPQVPGQAQGQDQGQGRAQGQGESQAQGQDMDPAEVMELQLWDGDPIEPPARGHARQGSPAHREDAEQTVAVPMPALELPPFLAPFLEGLEEAGPFEVDARLRRAVRLEQRLDSEIARRLCQVNSPDYEWRARPASLATYARERLGMSPRKARALIRLERMAQLCPELRAAFRDGRLSWLQAQILAPLLLRPAEGRCVGDWRGRWVRLAGRVTVRRLEELVDRALLDREVDAQAWEAWMADPEAVAAAAKTERQVCARPRDVLAGIPLRITAPRDVARLFRATLCTVRKALERETGELPSEAEGFALMIDHALSAWGIDDRRLRRSRRKRHAVFERDGWRCTIPGCTSQRNLQDHHIVFRSAGGPNTLENRTTLCAFHHLRGVHGGTVRVTGCAPDGLSFELGLRPPAAPLECFRSGDWRA